MTYSGCVHNTAHPSSKIVHYLDLHLLMKRSLEPSVKGRGDIYMPQQAREPLHSDSYYGHPAPDQAWLLCKRSFHAPTQISLSLKATAREAQNCTCIVRLCQLLITPGSPKNLHKLAAQQEKWGERFKSEYLTVDVTAHLSQWNCNGRRPASRGLKIRRIFIELTWLIWRLKDQQGKFLWRMQVWFGLLGLRSKEQQRGPKAIKFLKNFLRREERPALNSVLVLMVY